MTHTQLAPPTTTRWYTTLGKGLASSAVRIVFLIAYIAFLYASIRHLAYFFRVYDPSDAGEIGSYLLAISFDVTALILNIVLMFTRARMKARTFWGIWFFILLLTAFSWLINWEYATQFATNGLDKVPALREINPWLASAFSALNLVYSMIAQLFSRKPQDLNELQVQLEQQLEEIRVRKDHKERVKEITGEELEEVTPEKVAEHAARTISAFVSNIHFPSRRQKGGVVVAAQQDTPQGEPTTTREELLDEGESGVPATDEHEHEHDEEEDTRELPIFRPLQSSYDCPAGFSLGKPENTLDGHRVITLKKAAREWNISETALRQLADDESIREEKHWFTLVKPSPNAQYPTRMVDAGQRSAIGAHLKSQSRSRPAGKEAATKSTTKTTTSVTAGLAPYTPQPAEQSNNGH